MNSHEGEDLRRCSMDLVVHVAKEKHVVVVSKGPTLIKFVRSSRRKYSIS